MSRPKPTCGDVFLFFIVLWAIMDLWKNWRNYFEGCHQPVGQWILVSLICIVFTRTYQIIAYALSYEEKKEVVNGRVQILANGQNRVDEVTIISLNWEIMPHLKRFSYIQFVVYIFMIYWTVQGTIWFIQSDKKSQEEQKQHKIANYTFQQGIHEDITIKKIQCIRDTESYSFLIAWTVLNYFILLIFAIILITWLDMQQKSISMRKSILEIIRQVNMQDQESLDILENSLVNIQEEINRRQEFVRTLHEFGIFLMDRGIINNIQNEHNIIAQNPQNGLPPGLEQIWNQNNQDFRKIQTIVYLEKYRDMGLGRCVICLKDFQKNERVKRFPRECDHIFHIKCLEVWMKIQANCPYCLKSYLGHKYVNVHLPYSMQHESEKYSIFNEFQLYSMEDHLREPQILQNHSQKYETATIQEKFSLRKFSKNPFLKMSYSQQEQYMEREKKRKELKQRLLSESQQNNENESVIRKWRDLAKKIIKMSRANQIKDREDDK